MNNTEPVQVKNNSIHLHLQNKTKRGLKIVYDLFLSVIKTITKLFVRFVGCFIAHLEERNFSIVCCFALVSILHFTRTNTKAQQIFRIIEIISPTLSKRYVALKIRIMIHRNNNKS